MANLGREPLDRGRDYAERREILRVPVARDDLGRDGLDREAELGGDMLFDFRRHVGEGADRARDCAGRNPVARGGEALAIARELGMGLRELEPEGRRLRVDTVASPDGRREFVLERPTLEHREKLVEVLEEEVRGLFQLHGKRGVEHVAARHPLVKPAPLRPKLLAGPGQEGDHVMPGDRFDRIDRCDIDVAEEVAVIRLADRRCVLRGDHPDAAHRLGREYLDPPPDPVAVLGAPDGRHFGAGIAGDHGSRRLAEAPHRFKSEAGGGGCSGKATVPGRDVRALASTLSLS